MHGRCADPTRGKALDGAVDQPLAEVRVKGPKADGELASSQPLPLIIRKARRFLQGSVSEHVATHANATVVIAR